MSRLSVALLTVWMVAGLSAAQEITSPRKFLGFTVGADRKLADWQQIEAYFTGLASQSDRVRVRRLGTSTEGNPFLMALISSPANLLGLEVYRDIQKKLADPRLIQGDLDQLVERGRTIVLITCGIHSTEVASPQMSMEFAWDLATASDSETQEILDNVIFLFVPALNPDGVNIVVDWYRKTLGTRAEGTRPPRLYQKYVGHDNNRDWYMFTQRETRLTVAEIHNRWHPQIVYDVHQMGSTGARIFVPPFIDPYEPNVDPLLQAQIIDLGGFLFSALVASGRKGVVTNAIFDAYTPARAYQHYHGGVRILSESASARLATPVHIRPEQLGQGRNYHGAQPSWNFPEPWPGGDWRVRDIVDDQKVALRATLLHAARNRKRWLRNFHTIGQRNLNREAPYAFVVPADQRDPEALFDLLQTLEFGLVEIHVAQRAFRAPDAACVSPPFCRQSPTRFSAGTFLIYLKQPYGSFAKTLLEIQDYPALRQYPDGPLQPPYDVTAHTLGIQLGVEVFQVERRFKAETRRLDTIVRPDGRIKGEGNYWLFSHQNNSFARLANRLLAAGHRVDWATYGFRVGETPFPVGTLMARAGDSGEAELEEFLEGIPATVTRVKEWPQLAWQRIRRPRLGLYQSYRTSMDEGWTRWILEQNEFDYRSLHDSDVRNGLLMDLDVVVLADESPEAILSGLAQPYPKEFRGGIGAQGIDRLKAFVEAGGTLLCLGAAGGLPIAQWQPEGVTDVLQDLSEVDIPGSLLKIRVNPRHPIGYGMAADAGAMFRDSAAYEIASAVSVATYSQDDLLLSGWIQGQEHLQGRHAVVEVPMGAGRLILIGFRTQFRAQTRATYKFLFNSLFYATVR